MISPSVRVSLAIRLRRVSATEGKTGDVGVMAGVPVGVGVPGAKKLLLTEGEGELGDCRFNALGAGVRRRTSGRGSSFDGLDFDFEDVRNFIEGFLETAVSEVERVGGSTASDVVELELDAQVYIT